jgi:hypothetical protein
MVKKKIARDVQFWGEEAVYKAQLICPQCGEHIYEHGTIMIGSTPINGYLRRKCKCERDFDKKNDGRNA